MVFLEICVKIFYAHPHINSTEESIHLTRESRYQVLKHLEHLTSEVVIHCTSLAALKILIKLHRGTIDEFKNMSEYVSDAWPTLSNALFLLLDSSYLQDVVMEVVRQMSCGEEHSESCDGNLRKSIVRGVITLLMKYASNLMDEGMCMKLKE